VLVLAVGQQTHLGLIKFACSALLAKLLDMITTEHWCCFSVTVIISGTTVGYATTNSFVNKIWMLHRTQMLKRTRRNTIGRRSTRGRMMCRAFPLRLERQSSSLLSFVRFSYQFSSVICLFIVYKN